MTQNSLLPQNTRALVIGIEQYEAGSTWDLDGPASDAVRFLEYLSRRGVPKENIQALLQPLEPNREELENRAKCVAASVETPTRQTFEDIVTRRLPPLQADLFLLFWSGHGFVSTDGTRRLFTADAIDGDRRNVDLSDLMAALRTDRYPGLKRQALFIDTCANYVSVPSVTPPHNSLPRGVDLPGREQFALMAGASGEYAKSLGVEKSGLFSRELMTALPLEGPWPPDLPAVGQLLAERFIGLRREGKAKQTPTLYWERDWLGGERLLKDFDDKGSPSRVRPLLPKQLSAAEMKDLLNACLSVPILKRRDGRDAVLSLASPKLAIHASRNSIDRLDMLGILETARSFAGGLLEFLLATETFDDGTSFMQALMETVHQIVPEEVKENV